MNKKTTMLLAVLGLLSSLNAQEPGLMEIRDIELF